MTKAIKIPLLDTLVTITTLDPHIRAKALPSKNNVQDFDHDSGPSLLHVCLCVVQVQAALKRQWMQYKTQWGQRRKDHCSMRSTSYTATSITEVPAFMYHHDCNTEHLNGRHTEDSELVALKSGETYA